MNIERLYPLWFILCAAAGALLGNVTGYGPVQGLVDGIIVAVSPLFLIMLAHGIMSLWRPIIYRRKPPALPGRLPEFDVSWILQHPIPGVGILTVTDCGQAPLRGQQS
jgi:hypothetical protein